ncbi:MAG: diguanylate cyclase, partial [Comamonadaceae bacterium]
MSSPPGARTRTDAPAAVAERTQPRARVLVVDDHDINVRLLQATLDAEHDVQVATDGEQALAACRLQAPDLVLLDVMMPGMDGFEVCRRLKADAATRDIPVIFITALGDEQAETKGLGAGAVDFISKPIRPRVVRARVHTHLTVKRQADLLRSLVYVDGLTGLCNRRSFDESLARECGRATRAGSPLSVALVDVDLFKRYNDHYGHQAGDDCLRRVADAMASCLQRPGDVCARYGGEEFAWVLPDTDLEGALH